MQKGDQLYLGHMLDAARKAHEKVRGIERAEYDADEDLRLALAHLIQVIGEAASRVSAACQRNNPQVPWREITGIRHRIVHDYTDVNFDVIWVVAREDLPRLVEELERLMPAAGGL